MQTQPRPMSWVFEKCTSFLAVSQHSACGPYTPAAVTLQFADPYVFAGTRNTQKNVACFFIQLFMQAKTLTIWPADRKVLQHKKITSRHMVTREGDRRKIKCNVEESSFMHQHSVWRNRAKCIPVNFTTQASLLDKAVIFQSVKF